MLVVALLYGLVDVALASRLSQGGQFGLMLAANISLIVLGFRWLRMDALELDIRRPPWLNVAIILAAAIFVPYYMYKTRAPGKRMTAIGGFFGLVFGCALAQIIGSAISTAFTGAPVVATP